jgi:uncharacterized protein (UPF0332 family)
MVKEINKSESHSYIKQAEEFLEMAKKGFENELYNAVGFNAIQAIINANDAICIYFLGRRASTDHREAIKLHTDIIRITNDASQKRRLSDSLEMRTEMGYLGKTTSKNIAEELLKDAIIFIEWSKRKLR